MLQCNQCWCGNTELLPYGMDYALCTSCHTLISILPQPDTMEVVHDTDELYSKWYWFQYQQSLGYPTIMQRCTMDLPERNSHWATALYGFKKAPSKVLELGSSSGSFVALLQELGYHAEGVEMSPWVVNFGKTVFDIPFHIGPLEKLNLPVASYDCIAMMDVMEHLPKPIETLSLCLSLLKDDGILLLQLPEYWKGVQLDSNPPFKATLKPKEHLFIYSKESVTDFFKRLGCNHVQFLPPIFGHDMFLAVSKEPLQYSKAQVPNLHSAVMACMGRAQLNMAKVKV